MKRLRLILPLLLLALLLFAVAWLSGAPEAVAPFLNGLLMVAMPLALGVFIFQRFKAEWRLFGIGALTFIASQVAHIPFNAWVLNPLMARLGWQPDPGSSSLVGAALLLGLSAGIFEETARFLVYRFWIKDAREWRDGLMFGAGHGGVEAILLGLIVVAGFLQAYVLRDADLASMVSPGQLEAVQSQMALYWNSPFYFNLLGALERFFALSIHLSAALLVLQAFTRRNPLWFLAAILWHTAVDAAAVFVGITWGPYWAEGVLSLFFLAGLALIFILRPRTLTASPPEAGPAPQTPPLPPLPRPEVELTPDKLEDSRYD